MERRRRPLVRALICSTAFACSWAGSSAAQEGSPPQATLDRPDFVEGSGQSEAALFLTTLALYVGSATQPQLNDSGFAPDAGFHPYSHLADSVSDVTGDVGGALIGLTIGSGLEAIQLGSEEFLYATVIAVESWLAASGLVRFIKHGVGRCRPVAWSDAEQRCDPSLPDPVTGRSAELQFGQGEAYQAMPSGHVAGIAAISGAFFGLAAASRRPTPLRWTAFGATQALTVTTMILRVEAGAHSVSDTLVSWALSTAVGVSIAALHPRKSKTTPGLSARRLRFSGNQLVLSGTF